MKKRNAIIIICCLAISFGVVLSQAVSSSGVFAASRNQDSNEEFKIKETYSYGESIEVKSDSKIIVGEKTLVVTDCILTYPDGKVNQNTSFTLNMFGTYSITINASDNGTLVPITKTFMVINDLYATTLPGTTISKGELNHNYVNTGYKEGLKVEMLENDTFTYSKPFNIYDSTYLKLINFNILQYVPKIKSAIIKLTDCYNADNHLDIYYKRGTYEYETYVTLGANGGRSIGLMKDAQGKIIIDGVSHSISTLGGTLLDSNYSLTGSYNNLSLYLDTTDHAGIKLCYETEVVKSQGIISQLNNPSLYSYTFPGFTTGDVFLSITTSNYEEEKVAHLEIAELFGQRTADMPAVGTKYIDDINPYFLSSLTGNQIKAGVALNVPSIPVLDASGIRGNVDYTVWYNYDSTLKSMVNVNNGVFTPTKLGTYTIIYSATDYFGNVGTFRLDLFASTSGSKGIDIDVNKLSNVSAGTNVTFDDFNVTCLNDECDVKITVTDPKGNEIELEKVTDKLLLEYVGKYTVKYVLTDCFYETIYSYSFNTVYINKPSFEEDDISTNDYYIKNACYAIDDIRAYFFTENGKTLTAADAYVSFDGGEYQLCDRLSVKITGSSTVKFKYVAQQNSSVFIESEAKPIVDVNFGGRLEIPSYFRSEVFTDLELTDDTLNFSPSKNDSVGKIDFINKLIFSKFELNFFVPETSSINSFVVKLTDYYDHTNQISFTFYDGSYVLVDGKLPEKLDDDWKGKSSLIYIDSNYLMLGTNKIELSKVFASEYCMLSIEVNDVDSNSYFSISKVCNQPINNSSKRDSIDGLMASTKYDNIYHYGDEIEMNKFYFCDVLSPSGDDKASISARRTKPNSQYLVSSNGVELNKVKDFKTTYDITFDSFGEYKISYLYEDGAGNGDESTGIISSIKVIDAIPPTLKLIGYNGVSQEVSVNTEFTPLAVEVSDNYSSESDIQVWYTLLDSNSVLVNTKIKSEAKFKVTKAGTYKMYVYCIDNDGNSTFLSYNVVAK